jgi:hypothetical protein
MKQKFTLTFLIFSFTILSITAQHTLTIDDVKFDAGTGTITDYTASYTDIVIPSSFNVDGTDVNVTTIGDYAFSSNDLTSVTIPTNVTYIGLKAFSSNSLTSVTFEDNSFIRYISFYAFDGNSDLTSITLPSNANFGFDGYKDSEGVSYEAEAEIENFKIGYIADLPVHTLTLDDVDFDAVTGTISDYTGGYANIVIPSSLEVNGSDVSVTTIGKRAFSDNTLTDVIIPNSVTDIGDYAFTNNSLMVVTIPDGVDAIGTYVFYSNSLESVTIPNSVTYIGYNSFAYNSLTSIEIPNSVTYIVFGAFSYNSLTSVEIPNAVTYIGSFAFDNNNLTSIELPDPVIKEGYTFTEWHNSLGEVVYEITDFYSLYEAILQG